MRDAVGTAHRHVHIGAAADAQAGRITLQIQDTFPELALETQAWGYQVFKNREHKQKLTNTSLKSNIDWEIGN